MKMPSDQMKISASFMGLIVNQAAELHALRTFVAYLADQQGISPEHFVSLMQTNSRTAAEEILLKLGDSSPEIAELIDISGVLKEPDKGERE